MAISEALHHSLSGPQASRAYQIALVMAAWMIGSFVTAEVLDHWLHGVLRNSGISAFATKRIVLISRILVRNGEEPMRTST
jgi:hypothetical protein